MTSGKHLIISRTRTGMARKTYLTWGADGIPESADEFLRMVFGTLPETAISTSHITALVMR